MLNDPILNITNLSAHFSSVKGLIKAVDLIDFQLFKGEVLGIVGESGSGKSMTALSILRLNPKNSIMHGKVIYTPGENSNFDLFESSLEEMKSIRGREIAMIFQEPMTSLNPVIKCGQQIVETIQYHQKLSKEEAVDACLALFSKVKLPEPKRIFESFPHQLSGGQKQRVMIAMALSCNPKILIADEPTTALDVTVQKSILNLILELKTEYEMSVIFISHDLAVIYEIADRVLVMNQGKIVESGSVQSIFNNPKQNYTKRLISCKPPLDKKLKRLPTETYDDSISRIIQKQELSKVDIEKRNQSLYSKNSILQVADLKTWFSKKKNNLNLRKAYIKAVDGVSFEVFPGESLGLVGESGSGKTTLGRSLLKLENPKSGNIFYNGINVVSAPKKQLRQIRKDIQMIFQDPYSSLNPRKTVGNAILEPILQFRKTTNRNQSYKMVIELLERVGLAESFFLRMPHELSGGERQRVSIARALSTNPKFIICDECVSALDVSIQAHILNLLKDLQEEKKLTYIFISHDLSVVKFMSDRIMVMNNGIIEEIGDAEEIYNNPKTAYTKKLLDAIPKGFSNS